MPYRGKGTEAPEGEVDVAALEIEKKRNRLRLAKIRTEKLIGNRGAVIDGDPSKHYIWVNRHEARQNWFIGLGYVQCRTVTLSDDQASAATMAKLAKVEAEAKREALRQHLDEKATKRFVDEEIRLARPVTKHPSTLWEKQDGTHVRGDLVLYEIDKDEYEALQLVDEARGLELAEAPTEDFRRYAEASTGARATVDGKVTRGPE